VAADELRAADELDDDLDSVVLGRANDDEEVAACVPPPEQPTTTTALPASNSARARLIRTSSSPTIMVSAT
jgi:hypothetical protein